MYDSFSARVENAIAFVETQQSQAQYEAAVHEYVDSELLRITTEHPDLNVEEFAPFVIETEGDFDVAYEAYAAASTPPSPPEPQTLDGAIREFMAEQRARRSAPAVG
jgi:hypothetical protein